jgi:hypothetical protein
MDVAAQMAQVAIRFLCIGVQRIFVGSGSARPRDLQLLVGIRSVGNCGWRRRWCDRGRRRRGLLREQLGSREQANGY